ncbi:MAG TPA: hypothetical protein VFQ59_00075 [Candidatus Paceibacterota bacterium]|nr:hypothetical protein [Candidatus Paceibacterota bacterium]
MKSRLIIIIAILLTAFTYADNLHAEVKRMKINGIEIRNDFVVEPGKTEVFLNPGETITKSISITNRVNRDVSFKLTSEDLQGTDDPQSPLILLGDDIGPYSLKNFIFPEINEFTLAFGEKITIPVNISIPFDAEPRGYYGALIVSNAPDKFAEDGVTPTTEAEGKTVLVSRIGSLFLLRINGEGKEEGHITDFKIKGPVKSFYEHMPPGFEVGFKNTGNVHLVPYGEIIIRNIFGMEIRRVPLDAYFVLPNSTRYREIETPETFGFGRYTAELTFYRGYGTEMIEEALSFWVLPWKIILLTFFGLLVLVSLVYYILTRFELRRK